ncbi:MAG: hypothetical protein WBB23_22560 [Desulforhopalus sp.]
MSAAYKVLTIYQAILNQNSEPGRIDIILEDGQRQIPPAQVGIEKTMVSKMLPAAAPDLYF